MLLLGGAQQAIGEIRLHRQRACRYLPLCTSSRRRPRPDHGKSCGPIAQVRSRDQRLPANFADRNFARSDKFIKFRAPYRCQTAAFGDCEQQLLHGAGPRQQLAGKIPATASMFIIDHPNLMIRKFRKKVACLRFRQLPAVHVLLDQRVSEFSFLPAVGLPTSQSIVVLSPYVQAAGPKSLRAVRFSP
jgi:hypothetical protein